MAGLPGGLRLDFNLQRRGIFDFELSKKWGVRLIRRTTRYCPSSVASFMILRSSVRLSRMNTVSG